MIVGQALAMAPNYNKAKISAARVFGLLDRRPRIDVSPGVGLQIVRYSYITKNTIIEFKDSLRKYLFFHQKSSNGQVNFDKIEFHYPTRPSVTILKNLLMSVESGTSVALVGPSGCGMYTIHIKVTLCVFHVNDI